MYSPPGGPPGMADLDPPPPQSPVPPSSNLLAMVGLCSSHWGAPPLGPWPGAPPGPPGGPPRPDPAPPQLGLPLGPEGGGPQPPEPPLLAAPGPVGPGPHWLEAELQPPPISSLGLPENKHDMSISAKCNTLIPLTSPVLSVSVIELSPVSISGLAVPGLRASSSSATAA